MMTLLLRTSLLLMLLCSSNAALSATKTFIREYTYVASDLDSKVSARNNALKLIKAGVLEEIISYTSNTSKLEQAQMGDRFQSSFVQSASTHSGGFMRTRILEEKWDGFKMWIKAEVRANTDRIEKELEQAIAATRFVQDNYSGAPHTRPGPGTSPAAERPSAPAPQTMIMQQPAPVAMMPQQNVSVDYSGYIKTAQLSQVLALITPLRMKVKQYQSMNGNWPVKLSDIGLDASNMSDGQYIESIALGEKGAIFAFLNGKFGENKLLSYAPKAIMGGMNTRWICETNLPLKTYEAVGSTSCVENQQIRFDGKSMK